MSKNTKIDFYVKFDPKNDSPEDLTRRILYAIFVKRIKAKKPVVSAIIAKSGEGKSYGTNKVVDELMGIQGVDLVENMDFFDTLTIANPLQYAEKLDKMLFDKKYKKLNCMLVHEARSVVSAKNWRNFVNTAIADVNAMSRSIKPLMFFFVSQAFKDIDSNVRSTLTHYISISRPNNGNYSRMEIFVLWHDESDIEKPKFRRRKIRGVVEYPDGKRRLFIPDSLYIKWLRKELEARFDKLDYEGKSMILKNKMSKIMAELKAEIGDNTVKIDSMVDWYLKHTDMLSSIAKRGKRGWRVKVDLRRLHDLTPEESRLFEKRLNDRFKEEDLIREEEED
jgi:hypothetical protein